MPGPLQILRLTKLMKGTKLLKVAFLWSNEIYRPTNIVFSVATQRGAVSKDRGIFMTSQMAFA